MDIINRDTHKEIIPKLEVTNNLTKLIKRNTFGFRNFENFKKTDFYRSEHQKRKEKIGSIIFVVGKSPMDIMEPILL